MLKFYLLHTLAVRKPNSYLLKHMTSNLREQFAFYPFGWVLPEAPSVIFALARLHINLSCVCNKIQKEEYTEDNNLCAITPRKQIRV